MIIIYDKYKEYSKEQNEYRNDTITYDEDFKSEERVFVDRNHLDNDEEGKKIADTNIKKVREIKSNKLGEFMITNEKTIYKYVLKDE